ncbi:hypothetical protein [Candidatus Enterococcus mansonii]|uniref:Uncharacterized protein n=1 Tax=Candidatus Enterococcus mansonii TaxID=1834181 RepID=A0A242CD02_9ENTE|nr:hypothetical protein [Enterococcus sp. 4G2_DIV0659]OTO08076.1 hypothetical protein A5880_002346 [Enterococcus sp. 4G2_DIV0659]
MNVLDLTFIGLLSGAILFLFFSIICLLLMIRTARKRTVLKKSRPKNKRKQKLWKRKLNKLQKQRKSLLRNAILLFLLMLVTGSGAVYSQYYQMTNLSAVDSEALVKSYYLLGETKKQLDSVKNGASPEKIANNLRDITKQLVSAVNHSPNERLTEEGQRLLKRYYTGATDVASNIHTQSSMIVQNSSVVEEYVADLDKVLANQQSVFKHFKVNESALKEKK